jgi:hypothetical protein
MNPKVWARNLKLEEAEKLSKTAFVTVCAHCGDILSIRYDVGTSGLSHGICKKDLAKEEAKIERREV